MDTCTFQNTLDIWSQQEVYQQDGRRPKHWPPPPSCSRDAGSSSGTRRATGNCSSAGCSTDEHIVPGSAGLHLESRQATCHNGYKLRQAKEPGYKLTVQHFIRKLLDGMFKAQLVSPIQPIEQVLGQLTAPLIISAVNPWITQGNDISIISLAVFEWLLPSSSFSRGMEEYRTEKGSSASVPREQRTPSGAAGPPSRSRDWTWRRRLQLDKVTRKKDLMFGC